MTADDTPAKAGARKKPGRKGMLIEMDGETLSIAEWARRQALSRQVIEGRIAAGWSLTDALSVPRGARHGGGWPRKGGDEQGR
jgi:hypothetical protein